MKILKNERLANQSLITAYGTLTFDETGTTLIDDEAADSLAALNGFTALVVPDAPQKQQEDKPEETSTPESKIAPEGDSGAQEDENKKDNQNADSGSDEKQEDEEESDDDEAADSELSKLTVPALKKMAKEKGIDTSDLTKKAQLIEALTEAE